LTIARGITTFLPCYEPSFAFSLRRCCWHTARAAEPEKSVVQISTFSQQPDLGSTVALRSVRARSGSGFVIRGKRIMTNAHVIGWAKQLVVKRYQDPHPYPAPRCLRGTRL